MTGMMGAVILPTACDDDRPKAWGVYGDATDLDDDFAKLFWSKYDQEEYSFELDIDQLGSYVIGENGLKQRGGRQTCDD